MAIMSETSINKLGENFPITGIVALSQAVIGFGVGLLVGERLGRSARQATAIGCFVAGAAALAPVVSGLIVSLSNHPASSRRMRRRLASIREDAGLMENGDDF